MVRISFFCLIVSRIGNIKLYNVIICNFQYDVDIARILFTNVVNDAVKIAEDKEAYVETLYSSVNRMFTESNQYNTNFIGALLDIALKHKSSMMFDSNVISDVSQLSGLSSVGALLLEEYLISGIETGASSSKRSRGVVENTEDNYWVHLAM